MNEDQQVSDDEIVKRVLAGNSDEFKRLVLRHQDRIYSQLLRQVGDRELAKELAQDVFIRAFRGLPTFRFGAAFQTWLIRIALNVANSYFASRSFKEKQRTVEFSPAVHESLAEIPENHPAEENKVELLQAALGKLKPEFRDALVLCRIERKSYSEAAELLGIPEGTVCSRINTAVSQLRKQLTRRQP